MLIPISSSLSARPGEPLARREQSPVTAALRESLEMFPARPHVALFPRDPGDLRAAVVPFLWLGLGRREKCLLYCDPPTGDGILSGLREHGIDVGSALAKGAILPTRTGEGGARKVAFDPDALVSFFRKAARQARVEKYSALRICLDVSFALGNERRRVRILDLQKKIHSFLAGSDSLALCLYGMEELSTEILMDALRTHPFLIWKGRALEDLSFVHPGADLSEMTSARAFRERLDLLAERHAQTMHIRPPTTRLTQMHDVTVSLLRSAAVPDLLKGISEGVISLGYQMCWIGMARPDGSGERVARRGGRRRDVAEERGRGGGTPLRMRPGGG